MPACRPTLLGLPFDAASSYQRGAAQAPPRIRAALHDAASNLWSELGIAIDASRLADAGDLALGDDGVEARARIEAGCAALLAAGAQPLALGGDHSVSYPALRAAAAVHGPLTVVHVDAHADLYDEFEGNRYSHACPFARALEHGAIRRLLQIGLRTVPQHHREQAQRFGVEMYEMAAWQDAPLEALSGPIYVSLDLDGLDPAFAPGVSHPEPGGLATRDVVRLLHRLRAPIGAADIVEYNPLNDVRDLTARVAAKLLKELVAVAWRNAR
jgi:arginase